MPNIEFELALSRESLDGDLHMNRQIGEQLGNEFVEGVDHALRFDHDQRLSIYNAGGRNYYIPLPEAVGPYDALQVAGGGNFDLGITSNADVEDSIVDPVAAGDERVIYPPSETAGLFIGYTHYYEDGKLVEKPNVNPVGSYTAESANRKIENTRLAFGTLAASGAGVIIPMYAGKFEYGIPDQAGGPQTAILMLVPSMGRRLDSKILLPLNAVRSGIAPEPGGPFTEQLIPFYRASILPRLFSVGYGIATTHNVGFVHHQLTPGNTDALNSDGVLVPYITDWDTMTTPDDADKSRSQAVDMLVAFQSASNGLRRMSRTELIDQPTAARLILETSLSLLKGYFEGKGGLYAKHIDPQDAVSVAVNAHDIEKSLDLLEYWLK